MRVRRASGVVATSRRVWSVAIGVAITQNHGVSKAQNRSLVHAFPYHSMPEHVPVFPREFPRGLSNLKRKESR